MTASHRVPTATVALGDPCGVTATRVPPLRDAVAVAVTGRGQPERLRPSRSPRNNPEVPR